MNKRLTKINSITDDCMYQEFTIKIRKFSHATNIEIVTR